MRIFRVFLTARTQISVVTHFLCLAKNIIIKCLKHRLTSIELFVHCLYLHWLLKTNKKKNSLEKVRRKSSSIICHFQTEIAKLLISTLMISKSWIYECLSNFSKLINKVYCVLTYYMFVLLYVSTYMYHPGFQMLQPTSEDVCKKKIISIYLWFHLLLRKSNNSNPHMYILHTSLLPCFWSKACRVSYTFSQSDILWRSVL